MTTKIAISQFRSHCLEIINKVQNSKEPIIITKGDKPIVKLEAMENRKPSLFGMLRGKAEIKGDIISPTGVEWDAEK